MMSKNGIQGFLFNLAITQQMEVIWGIMMFHTIMMRKMICNGIYDFQLSHIESLNRYSCGTVAESVRLLQMQSSSLLKIEGNLYHDNCCKF